MASGDALLANTRAIGHVTVESRESYIRRKMAENGWDRQTAIAQATHLYPEEMDDLRAPWANRQLYTDRNGHSPDTAAQALHDDGRIADPTVDAFWDAVRGDIETIGKAKRRELDAAEAEAASALAWGKQRHEQTLAAIEMQDDAVGLGMGEARSSIGGALDRAIAAEEREAVRRQYEGTDLWMKAPNGKLTKLTERQWLQVRTPSFKAWFGDWENDPANASKVVDENGEPLVVFHGTDGEFSVFKTYDETGSENRFHEMPSRSYMFTPNVLGAMEYGRPMPVFINIRRLADFSSKEALLSLISSREDEIDDVSSVFSDSDGLESFIANDGRLFSERPSDVDELEADDAWRTIQEMMERETREFEFDGYLFNDSSRGEEHRSFGVVDNKNIKSATDNVGTFDPGNPNIRSSIGGLYSGGPTAYDRPSLRAIGTNDAGRAYGWGLYATTARDMAEGYAGATWRELANAFRFGGKTYAELTQDDPEAARLIEGYTATAIAEKRARGYDPEALKRDLQRDRAWLADYLADPENDPENMDAYPQSKQDRLRRFQTRLQNVERLLQADIAMTERGIPAVHEQLWWTNRPDGDESHLLTWDTRISEENRKRVIEAVRSLGLTDAQLAERFGAKWDGTPMTGEQAYGFVSEAIRDLAKLEGDHEALASQLLARHDVDGTVRHFTAGGSIYVAFSDEHLQVVRRWLWDDATQSFALDRSFTPPQPTMDEARATHAADRAVRSSIGGILTPRTEQALDALMLRAVEAQEEKNPEKAPFVTRDGIIAIPRYDLFFIPDHPSVAYGLYYQLIDRVYPSDIEAGARILGLDVPLAYEALATQLQHLRDHLIATTVYGERPDGAGRGGTWYVSDKRFNADMSTAEFAALIADIERWRNRLLGMAEAYDNGVRQIGTINAKLPGIHLNKTDGDAHWEKVVASTAFGKQRLETERQQRLTETEREALGNDEYKLPLEAVSTLATLEPVVRDQYDLDIETQKGPYGEGWARLTLPDGTRQSFKSNTRDGERRVVEQIKAFLQARFPQARSGLFSDQAIAEAQASRSSIIGRIGARRLDWAGYRLQEDEHGTRRLVQGQDGRTLLEGLRDADAEVKALVGTDFTRGERARATRLSRSGPIRRD